MLHARALLDGRAPSRRALPDTDQSQGRGRYMWGGLRTSSPVFRGQTFFLRVLLKGADNVAVFPAALSGDELVPYVAACIALPTTERALGPPGGF